MYIVVYEFQKDYSGKYLNHKYLDTYPEILYDDSNSLTYDDQ